MTVAPGGIKKITDSIGRTYYLDRSTGKKLKKSEWQPIVERLSAQGRLGAQTRNIVRRTSKPGGIAKKQDKLGRTYYVDKLTGRRLKKTVAIKALRSHRIAGYQSRITQSRGKHGKHLSRSALTVALKADITIDEAKRRIAEWFVDREDAEAARQEVPAFPTSP